MARRDRGPVVVITDTSVVLGVLTDAELTGDPTQAAEVATRPGPATVRADELLEPLTRRGCVTAKVDAVLVTTPEGTLLGVIRAPAIQRSVPKAPIAASSACDEAPATAGRAGRDPLSGHYGAPDVARGGLGMADEGERYFASEADVEDEGTRLRLIEQASDPTTLAHLDRIGVGAGWRCLEVGAGGGSVAAWLGERSARPATYSRWSRPTPPRVATRAECLDPRSQHRLQ